MVPSVRRDPEALAIAVLFGLLLVAGPLLLDSFRLNLMGKYMAFAFVAVGIVLTWGYGGMLSLGQGIFFGMGGYMMAMFLKLEASAPELPDFMVWSSVEALPLWWEPFRSFAVTVVALLVGPAVSAFAFSYLIFRKRVGGVYFAIVTLALAMTMTVISIGQQGQTGGANGITDFQTLLGLDILSPQSKTVIYLVETVVLGAVMAVAWFIVRSRFGKVLIAIRDREDRVRFSGYDTALFKAFVFTVAAVFSSIGGAFYSLQVGLITPGLVGVVASIEMVIYAAVGGRLSIAGAVVGALLIGFLKSYLSETFPEAWLYFLGSVFILVVVAMPEGLAGLLDRLLRQKDKAPAPTPEPAR
jgi:urea transport system permease protein